MGELAATVALLAALAALIIFLVKRLAHAIIGNKAEPALQGREEGQVIISHNHDFGPARSRIGLVYEDAAGQTSERIIRIAELYEAATRTEHSSIIAWCELRKDRRTFRADRIRGLFDPETGEHLDGANLAADPNNASRCSGPNAALIDLLNEMRDDLERAGWLPGLKFDAQARLTCFCCWRVHKRTGAPLKHPSLEFSHNPGFRRNPWSLRLDGRFICSWEDFDDAADSFRETAKLHAPKHS